MSPDLAHTGAVPDWPLPWRLKRARDHAGLDQHELAEKVGLSRNSVINYEKGTTVPKPYAVMAWAMCCGVSYEWLAGGGGSPEASDSQVTLPYPAFAGPSERHKRLSERTLVTVSSHLGLLTGCPQCTTTPMASAA